MCTQHAHKDTLTTHTHAHQKSSIARTNDSLLTSVNFKECRAYVAPLSIELLQGLSSEGHHTPSFYSIRFSTIHTCVIRKNFLPELLQRGGNTQLSMTNAQEPEQREVSEQFMTGPWYS